MARGETGAIRVEVVYALPGEQALVALEMPAGATVGDAIEASRLVQRFPDIDPARCKAGIFGRVTSIGTVLQEGDRVEIYRPLIAEPKEARRRRAGRKRSVGGR